MVLGDSDPAIEIVAVDEQQDVGQYRLGAAVHVANIVTTAGNDQQIGRRLQRRRFAKDLDQSKYVLALVRPGQGKDQRLVRRGEETLQLIGETDSLTRLRGMKLGQIGTRRDDGHACRVIIIVQPVLFLDFVVGAGDDQVGVGQHLLLGIDAPRHVVDLFDLAPRQALGQQPFSLVPPQRVAGMDQRYAQQIGQAHADVAGIGIVTVHQIRQTWLLVEPVEQVVHETVEVIPQLLLGDVRLGSGINAHDAGLIRKGFYGHGIIVADRRIDHPASDQIDPLDTLVPGQGTSQVNHVFDLPTGIGITTQFQIVATHQAMDADEEQVHSLAALAHGLPTPWLTTILIIQIHRALSM